MVLVPASSWATPAIARASPSRAFFQIAGLAVEVLAPQPDLVGDRHVGAAPTARLRGGGRGRLDRWSVGIPTVGGCRPGRPRRDGRRTGSPSRSTSTAWGRGAAVELEVAQAAVAGGGRPEFLDRVGLAHQLAERLAAMAVEFEDGRSPFGLGRQFADHAGDARKAQPTAQASRRCPETTSQRPRTRPGATTSGSRIPCSRMPSIRPSVCAFGVAVNRYAEIVLVDRLEVEMGPGGIAGGSGAEREDGGRSA